MGLALAGAISGAGEAMGKGLLTLESGFIQSGLMKEREELEQKRLEKTFAHTERMANIAEERAAGREKRQFEHAEKLQGENLTAQREMNQARIGAGLVEKGMEVGSRKDLQTGELGVKREELTQRDKHHTEDLGQKGEQFKEELGERKTKNKQDYELGKGKIANERQHYKDWKEVYGKYADARMTKAEGGSGEKGDGSRSAVQYLGQIRQQIASLESARKSAAEDFNQARVDQIDSMLEDAWGEYQAVQEHVKGKLGIGAAPAPQGIVDPRKVPKQ